MTEQEKIVVMRAVVINAAGWCIDRIQQEGTPLRHGDYVTAAGDVCMKLEFLLDWLRTPGIFTAEDIVRELGAEAGSRHEPGRI